MTLFRALYQIILLFILCVIYMFTHQMYKMACKDRVKDQESGTNTAENEDEMSDRTYERKELESVGVQADAIETYAKECGNEQSTSIEPVKSLGSRALSYCARIFKPVSQIIFAARQQYAAWADDLYERNRRTLKAFNSYVQALILEAGMVLWAERDNWFFGMYKKLACETKVNSTRNKCVQVEEKHYIPVYQDIFVDVDDSDIERKYYPWLPAYLKINDEHSSVKYDRSKRAEIEKTESKTVSENRCDTYGEEERTKKGMSTLMTVQLVVGTVLISLIVLSIVCMGCFVYFYWFK